MDTADDLHQGRIPGAWPIHTVKSNILGSLLILAILFLTFILLRDIINGIVENKIRIMNVLIVDALLIIFLMKGVYSHMFVPGSVPKYRFSGRYLKDSLKNKKNK